MGEVAEAVIFGDEAFGFADGAGEGEESDFVAVAADNVVVVLGRVAQLEVATRALHIHLCDDFEREKEVDEAKDGRVIGFRFGDESGAGLEFFDGEGFFGGEEGFHDSFSAWGVAEAEFF